MQDLDLEVKKQLAKDWFRNLRDKISRTFELIEDEYASKKSLANSGRFTIKPWLRNEGEGGGGEISTMYGNVFESVGVNISTVYGSFAPEFAKEIPNTENGEFWASGISVVGHMKSPMIPAVHFNTRFICTTKHWFGGGSDMTPLYPDDEDTQAFHDELKSACDRFNLEYYPKFKEHCDRYFFLPHRNESRGIGGIFYDYLNSGDWEKDFDFTKSVGEALSNVYPRIVRRHLFDEFTNNDREALLLKRGRYVEFNLLYDRGTRFGFMTGGNPEAILVSMPPVVKWHADCWKT